MKFLVFALLLTPLAQSAPNSVKVPGLDAWKIPYSAAKLPFEASESGRYPSDNHVLEIYLNKLSRAQYDALAARIPGGLRPTYQPEASYRLADFLPPFLSAVEGKQFIPMEEAYSWPDLSQVPEDEITSEHQDLIRFRDNKVPLGTFINCWTTVYEFLRTWRSSSSEIDITWLSRSEATQSLTETYTDKVRKRDPLAFGDIVVFTVFDEGPGVDLVQHAAIYVLPGLYFEKTDSLEDDAFRFVLETDLFQKYRALFGGKLKVAHYRRKASAALPRLAQTLSLAGSGSKDFWAAYIPERDLSTLSFQFDWEPSISGSSSPKFSPFRIHSIQVSKEGRLSPESRIFHNFRPAIR